MRVDPRRRAHLSNPALGVRYEAAPATEDIAWQLGGLCRTGGYDPNLFFPVFNPEEEAVKAKEICKDCPVIVSCAQWALAEHEVHGVWGGLSEGDRQHLWTGRPPRWRHHRTVAALLSDVVKTALAASPQRAKSRHRVG